MPKPPSTAVTLWTSADATGNGGDGTDRGVECLGRVAPDTFIALRINKTGDGISRWIGEEHDGCDGGHSVIHNQGGSLP